MVESNERWWNQPELWAEVFAILNVGFLTFDIYLAHSVNQFRNPAEYIPLLFSATSPLILIVALTQRKRRRIVWKILGHVVGWAAIVVGLTGVILHLESGFFYERTIRSLTYSAPFAAPLAYTGFGFLLVMNRIVDSESVEWAQWILLFTAGGFIGNFIFSLADHAGNGFFFTVEWVPVTASTIAISFLSVPLLVRVSRAFIDIAAAVLVVEAGVRLWGLVLHTMSNLQGPSV